MDEPTAQADLTESARFGQEMRAHREALGLSQARSAIRAGISQSRWKQLEHGYVFGTAGGTTRVSRTTAKQIASALNWPVKDCLRAAGYAPDSDEHDAESVLADLMELPPDMRAKLTSLIQVMRPPLLGEELAEAS